MININNGSSISLEDINMIVFGEEKLFIGTDVYKKVKDNYNFLKDFSKKKIIYGINTGFGPMAQYKIEDDKQKELQYNLIRSHAAGLGNPIDAKSIKSAMVVRLNCLMMGYSGIHPEVIELLVKLINNDVIPYIPEHGGVGASGDLVQLAHLALILIGEGKVLYKNKWMETSKVYKELGILPIKVHIREGLSLVNGTSVMTGIASINLIYARNLLNWMIVASVMINELVQSFDDHYSRALNSAKRHTGQQKIAEIMQNMLNSSKLTTRREDALFSNGNKNGFRIHKKVQEYYSLRCLPQILGPIYDTLLTAEEVITNEMNSISDNPIIDMENQYIFHGGHFHGDYVSLEMDKLKIVFTRLAMLADRHINFLMNSNLNNILPSFVNLGILGLNLGMQGAQFTAVSTTAECQTLSFPMYVHSIPNNNENQDIVSMGTNSALITRKVIENGFQVLAIEMISLIQAIDYMGFSSKLSIISCDTYNKLREIVPKFKEDHALYTDIENVRNYIFKNNLDLL